jgi:ribosomal peptide maturation radical SAM protein 1
MLLSPPLAEPAIPSLAVELLAGAARQRGHAVDTLHGALLQPPIFDDDLIHGLAAPGTFAPMYYGEEPATFIAELVKALRTDPPEREDLMGESADDLFLRYVKASSAAQVCVDEIVAAIGNGYDVIGFSIAFDAQKLPAAAVAKALRERGCQALMVAGGTGLDGEMGQAFLEQFAEFDLVLRGETDATWPRLLDLVGAGRGWEDLPGCVFRRDGAICSVREAPVGREFLNLPAPDYRSYLERRSRSPHGNRGMLALVETSRGCWWGRSHHCTFCGIKSVDEEYRVRPAADAVQLITQTYDQYRPDVVYCTDAICPTSYFQDVLPALARARRTRPDLTVFYETKSNLRRGSVARLAAAGVKWVQPGIESFSTPVLKAMNKGATALQQIAYLKWAQAYGISVTYGILTGTPVERAEHLRAMADLMSKLGHLRPPQTRSRLQLHRFSPYFKAPQDYGITDVQPFETQRVLYRCADERLRRLCYQLSYRVPEHDADYLRARGELDQAIGVWATGYFAGRSMGLHELGVGVMVSDKRTEDAAVGVISDPSEVLILRAAAEPVSLQRMAALHGLALEDLRGTVRRLAGHGLVLAEGDTVLTLPIPAEADAHADAAFDAVDDPPGDADAPRRRAVPVEVNPPVPLS